MPENENEKPYLGSSMKAPEAVSPCEVDYAELDVTTNFSFLRGASHPDELVYTAANLGYEAMAITDRNTVAGVVRAFEAAKKVQGFNLIVGARLAFIDGTPDLLVWPSDVDAYAQLCRLLTRAKQSERKKGEKSECRMTLDDLLQHSDGLFASLDATPLTSRHTIDRLADVLQDRLSLSLSVSLDGNDRTRFDGMISLSDRTGVPLLATNHVQYHDAGRRKLQDVLTCVRHGCTVQEAGHRLFPNAERYLKPPEKMKRLFADHPQAIERGLEIFSQLKFKLDQIAYGYPSEAVPDGERPARYLRQLTLAGARLRYPNGVSGKVCKLLLKELRFIRHTKYESYFLTVYDLVRFARSRGILCQGRGSAANSAVCFCLGVTSVDPENFQLVFERFASGARGEPPDIDIDFEHERREEVIQYVYEKYGRDRAAMTGSLTTYRGRSAIRDVGKALGLSEDLIDVLAGKLDWWHKGSLSPEQVTEARLIQSDPVIVQLVELTTQLLGFPRHLSQHVGGMVISRMPLHDIVPIEHAAMDDRTVIEWDKDDLDVIGLFKVDILALGMLTAISKGMKLVDSYTPGPPLELHTIPSEDKTTYDMISRADTVGVFQIESRAQMSMLPRLRPREFYDLVIEVAIVRPGPIQGNMVHPYLQRRERLRRDPNYKINYPKPELEGVLKQTLGVPLFQEQAMRLAIIAASFTAEEADKLRRAMAAWKRGGGLDVFYDKFINGMLKNGYGRGFAEQCFEQIRGFGSYGFPESHAASFARLVYASCWLKCHHPAAFTAALLNSQPMGFYAPAQLVRDAREHDVEVRPIDVNASTWDCTLEAIESAPPHQPALRLGMRQVKGLSQVDADLVTSVRHTGGAFTTVEQFQARTGLSGSVVRCLANADAFVSLAEPRRHALWDAMALGEFRTSLFEEHDVVADPLPNAVPKMEMVEEVLTDYSTTGLSLKRHPVSFAREGLARQKVIPASALKDEKQFPHDTWVNVAGLVLVRQRPGTASGVVFITLEDETGVANLILWSAIYEKYRQEARFSTLMQVAGQVQREGQVVHVLVRRVWDRSDLINGVAQRARNFH